METTGSTGCVVVLRKQLDVDLLRHLLVRSTMLPVLGATTDIDLAQKICSRNPASLVILDAGFPQGAAFDLGKELRCQGRKVQLLLLDDHYNPWRAELAESLPAAYCARGITANKLMEHVKLLAINSQLRPNKVNGLVDPGHHFRIDCPGDLKLTRREVEVLSLIAEGHSVQSCAKYLNISPSTVDNHKTRLMKKLKVHNSVSLVRIAIRFGLIEP